MEVGVPMTLASSAGTITFNDLDHGAGIGLPVDNGFLVQSVVGNEMPNLRTPNDNLPNKSGGMLHPFHKSTKIIVIEGLVVATKTYLRTLMDDHLKAVCEPGLSEDMTFTWHLPPPPYSASRFHTVRTYGPVEIRGSTGSDGMSAGPKMFHIELIAYKTDTEVY